MNNPHRRINIFALPNQTSLLFGIIVAVILGSLLGGSFNVAPLSVRPLFFFLLLIPIRSFLTHPERRYFHRYQRENPALFSALQAEIARLAHKVGLSRSPELLVFQKEMPLHSFGTFRHYYIAAELNEAMGLQKGLENPETAPEVQAALLHELQHFRTGDSWQLGYAGELLRLTFLVMFWALTFTLGYGMLLLMAKPAVLGLNPPELFENIRTTVPQELRSVIETILPILETEAVPVMEEARHKAANINISLVANFALSATYPFVLIGALLRVLYWPKMWRTREFYADSGSVQLQGNSSFLVSLLKSAQGTTKASKKQRYFKRFTQFHPSIKARINALETPADVFSTWSETALLVGSLAIVLEFMTMTPMTLAYAGRWPMHFPTLAMLVIISLNYLIPAIARGKSVWKDLLKIITLISLARLLLVLLILGGLLFLFVSNPQGLAAMLQVAASTAAGFAGLSAEADFGDLGTYLSTTAFMNLIQVAIVYTLLLGFGNVIAVFLRRLFLCYALPDGAKNIKKTAYWGIACIALFLGTTLLPLLSTLLAEPGALFSSNFLMTASFGTLCVLAGLARFLFLQKKYARRCPECGAKVPGPYEPGKRCTEGCGTLLHPWLFTDYKTED